MNTEFLFNNIIFFPILAVIVVVTYLIQFCSVISPCNIEFDGDSKYEMKVMNHYNRLSENSFTLYVSAVVAGMAVALVMSSALCLILLMILQIMYIIPAVSVMMLMYGRSKRYWQESIKETPENRLESDVRGLL